MASGMKIGIQIVKAIDRAHRQSVREAERRRKAAEREAARQEREHARLLKQQERERAAYERAQAVAEKNRFKQSLENARAAFDMRCRERKILRESIINEVLK